MTPDEWKEYENLLWGFSCDSPVLQWDCQELEAVNLLFRLDLVPRLSPAEFGAAFRYNMTAFIGTDGLLDADGKQVLTAMLAPWRDEIAAMQTLVDALPSRTPDT